MTARSPLERLARCMTGEIEAGLDWVEVIGTANDQRAAPALYRRLLKTGAAPWVDADALEYLRWFDDANRDRNRRIWDLLRKAVGELNAAGITPTVLKGGNDLAQRADPGDCDRILADLDILVPPDNLEAAQRVFAELGLSPMENSRHTHSPGSYWRQDEVVPIDLHANLPVRIARLLPEDGRARMIVHERDGLRFFGPDPTLHFFITIVHEMVHDRVLLHGTTELCYLLDLARQVEERRTLIDWRWLNAMRANARFRLSLDLQGLMMRHLLDFELEEFPEPGLPARLLHGRRVFKLRHEELGFLEWRILRLGLLARRMAGERAS